MFPRTVQRFTSTDQSVPTTKYAPGVFIARILKDIIPLSDAEDFPGPLLMDNNRGGIKAKRKNVLKYLNDQIKVSEDTLGAFFGEENKKKELEAIVIVWNLLKVMFENDGALVGSPKVEEAVRCILVPSANKAKDNDSNFTVPADSGFDSPQHLSESPVTASHTYTISSESVDVLQELLLKGDRVAAVNHAMNENLWAHALIIASCVNKDQWKEVVNGFIRYEMGLQLDDSQSNGRESLRVLYSLFAGNGQNSVSQFFTQPTLLNRSAQLSASAKFPNASQFGLVNNSLPVTSLYSPTTINDAPLDNLEKWRETLAMILANRSPGDNQAITALGDLLKEYGRIRAAHICYILSPQTSTQTGIDSPNSRFTLVGYDYTRNQHHRSFHDWQALRLTEIYEFGLSLHSNDGGLPFLQAYKLLYAWWLVDFGYLSEARRYCESIANIVKVYTKGSPYFHGCFLQELKDLTQRLLEHGGNSSCTNESSSSWLFAKKMPKATLDSLWGSLEGKFNKFVAGDAVDESGKKPSSQETVGPFSHFSAITHPTSDFPSRSVSAADFRSTSSSSNDTRQSTTPNTVLQKQVNGHKRRSSTPGVSVQTVDSINSEYCGHNSFSSITLDGQIPMPPVPEGQSSYVTSSIDGINSHYGYFGTQGTNGHEQYQSDNSNLQHNDNGLQSYSENGHANQYGSIRDDRSQIEQENNPSSQLGNLDYDINEKRQQMYPYYQSSENADISHTNDSVWWSNPNSDINNDLKQDVTQVEDYEGEFISPMDNNIIQFVPTPSTAVNNTTNYSIERDSADDDLGLGNNSFGAKKVNETTESEVVSGNDNKHIKGSPQEENSNEEESKEEKKGWFGRWFGKKEGGKTANLGEESSFYFDPVQKRWINKKFGANPSAALTTPQPTRAKTTSPTPSASMANSTSNRQSMPPPMGSSINSNGSSGSTSSPPMNTTYKSTLGGRSASSASTRRPVRARYVDIMNQPSSK